MEDNDSENRNRPPISLELVASDSRSKDEPVCDVAGSCLLKSKGKDSVCDLIGSCALA